MSAPGEVRTGTVRGGRTIGVCSAVGLLGLLAWLLAVRLDPEGALRAWLTAWSYGLSLALGALCMVMIAYVTGARWFVVVRRVAETMAISLPLLALGVIPLLVGMKRLYPWARPLDTLSPHMREVVGKISSWLDPLFFVDRAIFYLAIWVTLAALLWRWSVATDGRDPEKAGRQERPGAPVRLSAFGLVIFGFTVTFAAFDWLMSLQPDWHSTVFGIYWFSGAMLAALSAMVIVTRAMQGTGVLRDTVAEAHYYALGRLMLGFVVLWAYMAYSQGFLVWIGDIPSQVSWYLARWNHGWVWGLGTLAVAQFLLPFLVLLNYAIKRNARSLSWVAVWLLAVHWLDLYWVVGPPLGGSSFVAGWEQIPAFAAVLGLGAAFGAWRLQGRLPTPRGDPAWRVSLGYDSR